MSRTERRPGHGLDLFWEQADIEDSDEEPLARELCHRLDALARYRTMIQDAEAMGRDSMADALRIQLDIEAEVARDIQRVLRERTRAEDAGPDAR